MRSTDHDVSAYDSHDGITAALDRGLQGFAELRRERSAANYDRREILSAWLVLGRYLLDRCGNVLVLVEPLRDRPRVQSSPVFDGVASLRPIAPPDVVCFRCGRTWTLDDAHDYTRRMVDLPAVPGLNLKPVAQHWHASCRRYAIADTTRAEFVAAISASGLDGDSLLAVPNNYGTEAYAGPWFTLMTELLGRITVGWRRRVIQLEWERGPNGAKLFADEHVTVGPNYVHAWNPEKLTSYIAALLDAAAKDTP